MRFIIFLITIYILIKSISYSIYEFKAQKNKPAGFTALSLGIAQCVFTNISLFVLNR